MSGVIRPGTAFLDDRGRTAQLHGIGIQRIGDRWFAWGEDKTEGGTFTAIACYSSTDLATWRYEGDALTVADDDGSGDLAAGRVVERPKVLVHPDGRYVMLLHIDDADYRDARVGWAVADAPQGPYTYLGSRRPMGNESRDIGVYQDGAEAYLLSEDRPGGLRIYRLDPEWLGVAELVVTLRQEARPEIGYESPTLVRHEGLYYLFGSDLTGWDLNDNMYATAERLAGPWSPWRPIAPLGSRTHDSQVSVVLPVPGGHVYVGDRWLRGDLAASPAVWLPLTLHDGRVDLPWRDEWTLEEISR